MIDYSPNSIVVPYQAATRRHLRLPHPKLKHTWNDYYSRWYFHRHEELDPLLLLLTTKTELHRHVPNIRRFPCAMPTLTID
jgi:hypothetical protein